MYEMDRSIEMILLCNDRRVSQFVEEVEIFGWNLFFP